MTYGSLKKIGFTRTQTLGYGGDCCDFHFFKLSIVFFNMVVFWCVPARTIAKKYGKYKAFLYIEVQAVCCVLLFGGVAV